MMKQLIEPNKQSRYFFPDGSKKYYCIKCMSGPFHKDDIANITFVPAGKFVICNICNEKYYIKKVDTSFPFYSSSLNRSHRSIAYITRNSFHCEEQKKMTTMK